MIALKSVEEFLTSCTPREREVAELLMRDKTLADIGRQLKLSRTRIRQLRDSLRRRFNRVQVNARFEALFP